MSHMLKEINEQPDWVEQALAEGRENAVRLARSMREQDIRFVIIAARGTSDNAATYAKYVLEIAAGIPVSLAAPSVYTLYGVCPAVANTLVMGISQSGQGTDVVEVLEQAHRAGALTACVTNSPESPLAGVSDHVLLCHAGEEKAVAATKTYTTALAVVAQLAGVLSGQQGLLDSLDAIPGLMRRTLAMANRIEGVVERYRYMNECAVLGRGVNQATALEAALKLTETCYLLAKPYSGADFLHGPIAMIDDGFPCFVYAPPGKAWGPMMEVAQKIHDRHGELIVVTSEASAPGLATTALTMPCVTEEILSPLLCILPGQLFACFLSLTRGGNPDQPRGLSKVTRTR